MLWTGRVTKEAPLQLEPHFDLRITSAVLGKSAKKDQRYFLNCSIIDFPSEESVTAPLCSLSLGANENISLDISIDAGEPVGFTADTEIVLFGYYMENNDMGFPEEDSEDDEFQPLDMSLESIDEPDSDDSIEPRVEVLEDNILDQVKQRVAGLNKRKEPPTSPNTTPTKKQKVDNEPAKSPEPTKNQKNQKQATPQQPAKETPQKGKKEQQQNTPKGKEEKQAATPQPKQTPPKKETPQKGANAQSPKDTTTPQKGKQTPTASPSSEKKLKGGLVIQTVAPSNNPKKASAGNKVKVQYSGRLQSNQKQFDQGTFTFQLGAGKVIKGWDMGIAGMAVGERRKLTIPPNLAYGPKGMDGDIPPNATLEFDVTLISVQ